MEDYFWKHIKKAPEKLLSQGLRIRPELVEAGGIEPPSANPLPEGATCLDPSLI